MLEQEAGGLLVLRWLAVAGSGLTGWPSGSLAQAQAGAVLARGESRTAPWASRVAEEAEASWPEYGSGGESWGEVLGNERAEEGARLRWIDGFEIMVVADW